MSISESICRVCLGIVSCNNHHLQNTQLLQLYEKLTCTKLCLDHQMPQTICCYCYSQLRRLGKFSDMARRSERVLTNLFTSGVDKVTPIAISTLNMEPSSTLAITPAQTIYVGEEYTTECLRDSSTLPTAPNRQVTFMCMYSPSMVKVEANVKDEASVKTEKNTDTEDSEDEDRHSVKEETSNASSFCCDICSKGFSTIHLLKSHLISHSGDKPHVCQKCNKSFSRKHNMVQHMKTCTTEHVKSEPELDDTLYFYCEVCNKKFTSKALLRSHKVIHSGEKPYSCEGCKKSFARKQGMKQHMIICTEVKPRIPTFPCPYCAETFDCESDLNSHIPTHPKDKPYTCDKCHKSYTTKPNLKQHMKICFLENEVVACSLCTQTFRCRSDLCKHLNADHASQKPFCCDRCSAKFWYKSHLKVHMRIHTGERPFACEICGKTFTLRNHLKAHLGSHSGLKPHACELCGKAFLSRFNLREHMRRHTGERPYPCGACGKRFGHQSTLRQHLRRVHSQAKPFVCEQCPLSFALESGLASHTRVHTAARPYACDICDKAFFEARYLKGHMQVHSTDRPHTCTACGNAYKRPEHLKLHVKSKCKAGFALSSSCLPFEMK